MVNQENRCPQRYSQRSVHTLDKDSPRQPDFYKEDREISLDARKYSKEEKSAGRRSKSAENFIDHGLMKVFF